MYVLCHLSIAIFFIFSLRLLLLVYSLAIKSTVMIYYLLILHCNVQHGSQSVSLLCVV